ncbi:MAG: response regulator transcription factor [Bacteriovoracaceae bacterium]|nr:response regulator transcription factor [Bacteriovoracaceae bacterium]
MSSGNDTNPKIQSKSKILVVEDDHDARSIIKKSLEILEFEIIEAFDGVDAQEKCQKKLPDAIVLDLMMPRLNGIDFLKWFREIFKSPFVPVLMLTALTDIEDKVQGLHAGADDYLGKPFHFKELQARVEALLRIKYLTNQLYQRNEQLEVINKELVETQNALVQKERELLKVQITGAAAHNLGQPITTILLNCRLIEKSLEKSADKKEAENSLQAIKLIKKECESMNSTIEKLKNVNVQSVAQYLGNLSILDIEK